jgi:selenocysteine lyase/cysteine desulfurase
MNIAGKTPRGKLVTDDSGWLQYHSVGRFPGQRQAIGAALGAFADVWLALDDRRWLVAGECRRRAMALWGKLVGASEQCTFAAENVTLAFGAFIDALPPSTLSARKVLIAEDCFPSLYFLMVELAKRIGFRLETVRIAPGASYVSDQDFVKAWDRDVALAMVNWVTSVSSKRADLPRLLDHARSMGSMVALDITQGVGILPLDLAGMDIDFAAATSLKWLCGVPGAGFAYVRPNLLDRLNPRVHGWHSQPDPTSWVLDRFSLAPDARRFGNGTSSPLPYIGSLPGIEWVLAQGVSKLAEHNLKLCHRLIEIVDLHGLTLASPRDDAQRGGSVMIALSNAAEAEAIRLQLLGLGFICDARSERLRWSPGCVTTMEALDALDEAVGQIRSGKVGNHHRPEP